MYSHSRLAKFENCPFSYKLRYVDKIKIDRQGIEAFVGTMVHEALEKLYKDVNFGKTPPLDELLAWAQDNWKKNWNEGIAIVKKDYGQEEALKLAAQYITDYYNRHKPFTQSRTVGLEKRIQIDLDKLGVYKMEGYIDRLSYTPDNVYEIHDYKTGKTLPSKEQTLEDRQLALYSMAVKSQYPNAKEIHLIWHYLHFNQDITSSRNEHELEKLRQETIEVIREIEKKTAKADFPTHKSMLCGWCEYKDQCPEWVHIIKTEKLAPDKYANEPGVKLVDKYAALDAKKEEAQAELSAIKNEMDILAGALVKFSDREKATTIAGTSHTARVWTKDTVRFPASEDANRAALEKVIIEAGKWQEASRLDTFRLEKIFSDSKWPQAILDQLKTFATPHRVEKIYLKKKLEE